MLTIAVSSGSSTLLVHVVQLLHPMLSGVGLQLREGTCPAILQHGQTGEQRYTRNEVAGTALCVALVYLPRVGLNFAVVCIVSCCT